MFANDTMVIPKESEWLAFYTPGQDKEIMPLEQSAVYLTVSNISIRILLDFVCIIFIFLLDNCLCFYKH